MGIPIPPGFLKRNARRFGVLFSTAVVVTLGSFLLYRYTISGASNAAAIGLSDQAADRLVEQIKEKIRDTDQDGLQDWEEEILKTDLQNADTDSDGTPDGEEIRERRDPLLGGPNDGALALQGDPGDSVPSDPSLTGNLTYALADSLFKSGVFDSIGENGELTSTDFLKRLDLPAEIDPNILFLDVPTITRRDITIVPVTDPAEIIKYFSQLSAIAQKHLALYQESDIEIFVRALEASDFPSLDRIAVQREAVGRAADEIARLPVPERYADIVIKEINDLHAVQHAMALMQNVNADPIAAILAFQKRIKLMEEMTERTASLQAELKKAGILPPA